MRNDALVKNIIAKALGAFWVLDGLLQLQPAMFGQDFVSNILTPLLDGQPSFLHVIIAFGIQTWDTNTIVTNSLAALLQIGIGILLFFPLNDWRFKAGAYISIIWSLVVWVCGEGVGSLFTGSANLYAGAPGAVLFYLILAVFLLMPERISAKHYPSVTAWTLLFGSVLQLQPLFWTANGIHQAVMAPMMEAIPALSGFPTYLLSSMAAHANIANIALIVLPLGIGIALLLRPNRMTGMLALVFLFISWWVGQDFGQLSSIFYNTPTDPQLAPLLALFLVPLFITADVTSKNKKQFETAGIVLGTGIGLFLFGIIMYGVVVVTLQNAGTPSTPLQMHMSS